MTNSHVSEFLFWFFLEEKTFLHLILRVPKCSLSLFHMTHKAVTKQLHFELNPHYSTKILVLKWRKVIFSWLYGIYFHISLFLLSGTGVCVWFLWPGVRVVVLCAEYHAMVSWLRIRGNVASMLNRHTVIADYREGAFHPRMNAWITVYTSRRERWHVHFELVQLSLHAGLSKRDWWFHAWARQTRPSA